MKTRDYTGVLLVVDSFATPRQRGFTLVELAIVMTIIGLLIGGILKGQELMVNARITATIAQIRSYEAAITSFRDTYAVLPGDMPAASNKLRGCTTACNPPLATAGNSIVGSPQWSDSGDWTSQAIVLATNNTNVASETVLFWLHLLQADLIAGVSTTVINGVPMQWGITHPMARINGGFIVGYADGLELTPGGASGGVRPSGLQFAIVTDPTQDLDETPGIKPMTPGRAAIIDRKMDDGRPSSGFVQGYGVETSCFTGAAAVYNESITVNDCGVLIRVQG